MCETRIEGCWNSIQHLRWIKYARTTWINDGDSGRKKELYLNLFPEDAPKVVA